MNHQLDFWIGSWTVTPWTVGPTTPPGAGGTNVVEQDLEQCLLVENWRAANGSRGRSFNFYDTNHKKWRQVWVAEGGRIARLLRRVPRRCNAVRRMDTRAERETRAPAADVHAVRKGHGPPDVHEFDRPWKDLARRVRRAGTSARRWNELLRTGSIARRPDRRCT